MYVSSIAGGYVVMASDGKAIEIDTQALWSKYEDIAIHFNGLLMRLRSGSLAAVAAASTVVGILADEADGDLSLDWLVAAGIFSAMSVVWIAIFCLDLFYYNKLLNGAVSAITQLESDTLEGRKPQGINLSMIVENEFTAGKSARAPKGVLGFYTLVFGLLIAGALFSARMSYLEPNPASAQASAAAHSPDLSASQRRAASAACSACAEARRPH